MLIVAALAAMALFTTWQLSPLVSAVLISFVVALLGALLYRFALLPLVRRSRSQDELEADTILATFGLLFFLQGVMLAVFGGNYLSYSFLAVPVEIAGTTIAANRLLGLVVACVASAGLYILLTRTRIGTALRAVAVNPGAAPLVGINVVKVAMLGFALGAGMVALAGVLLSMFSTFNATMGVVFTMKALIVVIMGGIGNFAGCLVAALILGLVESFVSLYGDPSLTLAANYGIFLLILIFRPAGLFGRATA